MPLGESFRLSVPDQSTAAGFLSPRTIDLRHTDPSCAQECSSRNSDFDSHLTSHEPPDRMHGHQRVCQLYFINIGSGNGNRKGVIDKISWKVVCLQIDIRMIMVFPSFELSSPSTLPPLLHVFPWRPRSNPMLIERESSQVR